MLSSRAIQQFYQCLWKALEKAQIGPASVESESQPQSLAPSDYPIKRRLQEGKKGKEESREEEKKGMRDNGRGRLYEIESVRDG